MLTADMIVDVCNDTETYNEEEGNEEGEKVGRVNKKIKENEGEGY